MGLRRSLTFFHFFFFSPVFFLSLPFLIIDIGQRSTHTHLFSLIFLTFSLLSLSLSLLGGYEKYICQQSPRIHIDFGGHFSVSFLLFSLVSLSFSLSQVDPKIYIGQQSPRIQTPRLFPPIQRRDLGSYTKLLATVCQSSPGRAILEERHKYGHLTHGIGPKDTGIKIVGQGRNYTV